MAVGTVSGIETTDNWQLIQTSSATGVNAVTLNSISGYSRIMIVWKALRIASGTGLFLKANNDTTSGNYGSMAAYTSANNLESENAIPLTGTPDTQFSGLIVVENVNKSTPHQILNYGGYRASQFTGAILFSDPITRLDVYSGSSANFTAGTVQFWGIAG